MAGLLPATDKILNTKHVFTPQEPPDQPCDVTLVVEDGKEFKAHRQILSETSPFFEKLLNSGLKESKEGTVRLEALTASAMGDILEFIYTGSVQIPSADHARDMIAMADYLLLVQLKTFAGKKLVTKLNVSNCISFYYFAKRYRCQELISEAKNFVLEHIFTVANTVEFLNLSSEELKMWISSDEINVTAEEDVFKLVLTWIHHDKSERKRYFAELFRQVRLVYVSRDYLISNIVTNDLVKDNEGCLDLVNDVVKLIDSNSSENLYVNPRKTLETLFIVVSTDQQENILCYNLREDKWFKCPDRSPAFYNRLMFSCYGKLYFYKIDDNGLNPTLSCYESFSNSWTTLPFNERRDLQKIFVRKEEEIYALVSEDQVSCLECVSLIRSRGLDPNKPIDGLGGNTVCGRKHLSAITKYRPESNLWEEILSFDLASRRGCCIVAKDAHLYFIGGANASTNADSYDLTTNKWDKIADIQKGRSFATGAAAHGKIFITGGLYGLDCTTCEVYNETTNEWHYVARLPLKQPNCKMVCVDGSIYVMDGYFNTVKNEPYIVIHCYDPVKNKWNMKTELPMERIIAMPESQLISLRFCSMRIFKESNLYKASTPVKLGDHRSSSFCLII